MKIGQKLVDDAKALSRIEENIRGSLSRLDRSGIGAR